MKNIGEFAQSRVEEIKKLSIDNAGKEYRSLWVAINFAVVKDSYIKQISAQAFGIFMVIRAFMNNKNNIAYPALETIANLSDCSVSTVRREINKLEKYGWIKKVGMKRNKKGSFGNMQYQILQTDLIRGSNQPGFMKKPLVNMNNGK